MGRTPGAGVVHGNRWHFAAEAGSARAPPLPREVPSLSDDSVSGSAICRPFRAGLGSEG
jgi:hypothetical protein